MFGAKICSDICRWTFSVTQSLLHSLSYALGKPLADPRTNIRGLKSYFLCNLKPVTRARNLITGAKYGKVWIQYSCKRGDSATECTSLVKSAGKILRHGM